MGNPLTRITMQDYKTDKVSVFLEAYIDADGTLILSGQDIGSAVEEYWGDSHYEYFLHEKKADKEKIPLLLVKERFTDMPDFLKWLSEKGIPGGPGWGKSDFETYLDGKADYKDTVLLWLLKERFSTMSDFMTWLNEKNIPKEFGSWV